MLFKVDELWILVSVLVAVLLWNANWYWVVGISFLFGRVVREFCFFVFLRFCNCVAKLVELSQKVSFFGFDIPVKIEI